MTRKRQLLILLSIGALIIIGIIINALIPRATLVFAVAPENVKVTINGKSQDITNGQSVTVSPGDITIQISRDEFTPLTQNFTLKNHDTKEILIALDAQTDNAKQLLETSGAQDVIQRIGGKKVQEGSDALIKAYPLLKELPINERLYKIVPCSSVQYPDDSSKIAICIQLFQLDMKESALDEITRRGYDTTKYEIIFQDLTYKAS